MKKRIILKSCIIFSFLLITALLLIYFLHIIGNFSHKNFLPSDAAVRRTILDIVLLIYLFLLLNNYNENSRSKKIMILASFSLFYLIDAFGSLFNWSIYYLFYQSSELYFLPLHTTTILLLLIRYLYLCIILVIFILLYVKKIGDNKKYLNIIKLIVFLISFIPIYTLFFDFNIFMFFRDWEERNIIYDIINIIILFVYLGLLLVFIKKGDYIFNTWKYYFVPLVLLLAIYHGGVWGFIISYGTNKTLIVLMSVLVVPLFVLMFLFVNKILKYKIIKKNISFWIFHISLLIFLLMLVYSVIYWQPTLKPLWDDLKTFLSEIFGAV